MAQQGGLFFESQSAKVTLDVLGCPQRSVWNSRVRVGNAIPLERRTLQFQLPCAKHPRTETNWRRGLKRWLRDLVFNFALFRWAILDRRLLRRLVGSAFVASPVTAFGHAGWRRSQTRAMERRVAFATEQNRVLPMVRSKMTVKCWGGGRRPINQIVTCSWTSLQTLQGRQSGHFHSDSGTRGKTSWSNPKHLAWTV